MTARNTLVPRFATGCLTLPAGRKVVEPGRVSTDFARRTCGCMGGAQGVHGGHTPVLARPEGFA